MSFGKHYDLKLGYSCNNKCVHCIIESCKQNSIDRKEKIDFSYGEIIKILNSEEFKKAKSVTITGGEPTLRKDFDRIIKYIGTHYPDKAVNLQTNGRLLYKYINTIGENIKKIGYVVAIHSIDKDIHDKIVGVEYTGSNSYNETFNSLLKLKEYYGEEELKNILRIEIVLSKYNLNSLVKTVKELSKLGFKYIGISYPHADGFYQREGVDGVKKFSISYEELKPVLNELYQLVKAEKELRIEFEEVPYCMFRDNNDNLLKPIDNLGNMSLYIKDFDVTIHMPKQEATKFNDIWESIHEKTKKCKECVLNNHCAGVWFEAIRAYGDKGFVPISEEEFKNIGGKNSVFNYIK